MARAGVESGDRADEENHLTAQSDSLSSWVLETGRTQPPRASMVTSAAVSPRPWGAQDPEPRFCYWTGTWKFQEEELGNLCLSVPIPPHLA